MCYYVLLCIAMPLGIVGSRDFQLCHSASQGLESRFMAHSYFHVSFRTAIGYSLNTFMFLFAPPLAIHWTLHFFSAAENVPP